MWTYTGDAGFHGGHKAVIQGAQIGGIVLAPCHHLPRCTDWRHCISPLSAPAWGSWVGVVYTGDTPKK